VLDVAGFDFAMRVLIVRGRERSSFGGPASSKSSGSAQKCLQLEQES
jgi:hypothetical protein